MLTFRPADRLQLAAVADREIEKALGGQGGTLPPASKTEATGILLSDALPRVSDRWRPILAETGVSAKLYAAFTFSAPLAEVRTRDGATHRRELGDVLVIVDDLTSARPDRRAVLLRASLMAKAQDAAGDAWLDADAVFRLPEMPASAPGRSLRDPSAPGSAESGTALAVFDLAAATVRVEDLAAAHRAPLSLGEALVAIAAGEAGRQAIGGGADDWSATVDDLLRATLLATSSGLAHAGGPTRTVTRHAGDCGTGFVVFDLRRPVTPDGAEAQPRADGPLSIVHIVFGSQRDEPASGGGQVGRKPH